MLDSERNASIHLWGALSESGVQAEGEASLRALESYYAAGRDEPELPVDVTQLLEDRRNGLKRHLRRELVSPFEGDHWQVIRKGQGRIEGVVLDSERGPARKSVRGIERLERFRDWRFVIDVPRILTHLQ